MNLILENFRHFIIFFKNYYVHGTLGTRNICELSWNISCMNDCENFEKKYNGTFPELFWNFGLFRKI